MNGVPRLRQPSNEPALSYAPSSKERAQLKARLKEMRESEIEIPLIIGGQEVRTGTTGKCLIPHNHGHVLATYHMAGPAEVRMAIDAALAAKRDWESMPWEHRIAIFLRAAELSSGPWRQTLNAATMLCQSKTAYQAEVDSACELTDFFRFNSYYAAEIYGEQPNSSQDAWNRTDWRPLEGFVFAATPFNFTSIAGNLPSAPAILGNTVVWKPASSAVYSAYHLMKLFQAAGLPAGVINFIPGPAAAIGNEAMTHPMLAGIHFTGSTETFRLMWRTVGSNIANYRSYPRIVGETGGKDFIVVHPSADRQALLTALIRGAFEYQGQKCSAASRAYIPQSVWPKLKDEFLATMAELKVGDVEDFRNFMGAVIDKAAFDKIRGYIEDAKRASGVEVYGGECDDSTGYFVKPTLIVVQDPFYRTMQEEIFGPVLSIYVYPDGDFDNILDLCDRTSTYGLTGSIFAQDRSAVVRAEESLRHAAGNFYINDKPTGAVVSQQPFGGARASGTNDKAGSKLNLYRWLSARAIKEALIPAKDYRYPFMLEE